MIEIRELSKTYGSGSKRREVLKDADFSLSAGAFGCILGPSGSGKSTLLHIIGGLDRDYRGVVKVGGLELATLSDSALSHLRGKRIGFVFQSPIFLEHLDAVGNLALAARFAGTGADRKSIMALLERFALSDLAGQKPGEMSGGQAQRLALARALAGDPLLLLADEPTGNLDEESASLVLDEFLRRKKEGKTLLLVTHDMRLAQKADAVFRLQNGKLQTV